ncbi:unnamed protein product [Closterium sp. NIES-65]|nr:unnamed protein product [Closterium sp. NIES-65]
MNHILRPLLDECVVVYLDDILIYSKNMKEHVEHLRKVFEILRKNKFYVKLSKSDFALKKVQFLGHMVSAEGVHVDPQKIKAVKKWKVRWVDFLETHFHYDIVYKPGLHNKADALSRPGHVAGIQLDGMNPLLKGLFQHGYSVDAEIATAQTKKLLQWEKDLAVRKGSGKIWVPNYAPLRQILLEEFHDVPYAGHFGSNKTLAGIAKYYYWPGMAADVQQFVTSCDTCQRMKSSKQKKAGLLQPLPVPERPWQVVSLDFITGLPSTSQGHDSILVVIDKFYKMGHFIPTNATATAEATARLFFARIITIHGIPATLISDRDPKFTSKFWKELMGLLGTKLAMSSAYHPQTDGQTERLNQVVTPVTFRLRLPDTWKLHNAFHVQLLKPYKDPNQQFQGRQLLPPPPVLIQDEPEYEIERVLSHRRRGGKTLEFLIRWKGYDPTEDSWVAEADMGNARRALKDYLVKQGVSHATQL